jgi:hypothetical protein
MINLSKEGAEIFQISKSISSHEEAIQFLHNKFLGETCYVLGCGPSIVEAFSGEGHFKLIEQLNNNYVLTIKAAHKLCEQLSNFQIYNSNNLMSYDKSDSCIHIAQADFMTENQMNSVVRGLNYDINVQVTRGVNNGSPLTVTRNLEDWTFSKTGLTRCWGPGIMYETVFYFLLHLGFKNIKTIGWDYKDPNDRSHIKHFYSESDRLSFHNPAEQPDSDEIIDSITLSNDFNNLFIENEISLSCYDSDWCHIHQNVNRFRL